MSVYDVTMRTVIDVPDEVIETLDRVSASEQRSRASVIREALAKYVDHLTRPDLEAAFGVWRNKAKDGVDYQNDLRKEW
mgnify:CR=1 FL=1